MAEPYKKFVAPLLNSLGHSETLHHATLELLHYAENPFMLSLLKAVIARGGDMIDERIQIDIGNGVRLRHPVGIAGGYDKNGQAVASLFHLLHASAIEIGTVVPNPQEGNPRPRLFMDRGGVALNHMGFPSQGVKQIIKNLERYSDSGIPLGISLGKNKTTTIEDALSDYARVMEQVYDIGDYFVINVSSPNTLDLRRLQEKSRLADIIATVTGIMQVRGGRKPLYIKISPELSPFEIDDIIELVELNHLTGIIASNTTLDESIKAAYGERWQTEPGGLSGDSQAYRDKVRRQIAHIYETTEGNIQIVGVGGVKDASTALNYMASGAHWVQIFTAIRGEGPRVIWKITDGITKFIDQHGINHIQDIVGSQDTIY